MLGRAEERGDADNCENNDPDDEKRNEEAHRHKRFR